MKRDLALYALGEVMQWDSNRATAEFAWLSVMSRMKYDGYRDFLAGSRFVENLVAWLQQFALEDREIAYQFIRQNLVYIGPAELQHLVELAYPETVQPRLLQAVAQKVGIPTWRIWAESEAIREYNRLLRRTLFLGLSDGARIDAFRRSNAGIVSNEQVVAAAQLSGDKWNDLLKDLRRELQDPQARFAFVFLLDDFTASGASLIRPKNGGWTGKLWRFWQEIAGIKLTHFEEDLTVCIHHYLATHRASTTISERYELLMQQVAPELQISKVEFSFGTILAENLPLDASRQEQFIELTQRYYDPAIMTESMQVGEGDGRLGFDGCALPLILEHNTPNNSVALLWAETSGDKGAHAMRPLFRRRQRHL